MRFIFTIAAVLASTMLAAAEQETALLKLRQRDTYSCAQDCVTSNKGLFSDSCNVTSVSIDDFLQPSDDLLECVCDAVDKDDNNELVDCVSDCGLEGAFEGFLDKCPASADDEEDAATVRSALSLLTAGGLLVSLIL